MRGSPLIRFFLLALALAATGAGLARITAAKENLAAAPTREPKAEPSSPAAGIPYRLILSDRARLVEIDTGSVIHPPVSSSSISGTLQIDPKNPRIGLRIEWATPAGADEHRFAKLTLEAPGQPTLTHVFDSAAEIDELLELPLPAAP